MRAPRLLLLCCVVAAAHDALAYEGAGRVRDEDQPPPPPKLTKAPTVKKAVEAKYPEALIKLSPQPSGTTKLMVDIAVDGHVPNAVIGQSSGFPEMDASALAAIQQFEFTPAEIDGKPALIRLEYDFNFAPPPPPPPPAPDAPPKPPPVNLKGRVLERGSREPLRSATIYLPESGLHAETDKDGRFEIAGAPLGPDKVEVNEQGHKKFFSTETIKKDQVTEVTYYLWKKIEGDYEATVRGEKDKKEVSEHTLQGDELTTVPGTFGDPVRVIMNMPGIAILPYGFGALLVRGASPGDTQTLIDGVPIPILFHFAGGPSVLNPSFIDKVNFYPGAYSAKYGRAIAGIVDVETKPPEPKAIHGDFDVDLLQSNFYLEGPMSKDHPEWGTWELAARRSYLDTYLPTLLKLFLNPGTATISAVPVYWDYQGRYDVKVGRQRLELSVFGSDDQIAVAQAGTPQGEQGFSVYEHQGFHRLRLRWSTEVDGWTFSVSPSAGPSINSFDFSQQVSGSLNSWDWNVRGYARKNLLKSLTFETGLEANGDLYTVAFHSPENANYVQFPAENANVPYTTVNSPVNLAEQAAYAEVVWNPWRGLKIIPGIRLELYELPKFSVLSAEPRVAIRYEFPSHTTLKAAWGEFAEPPAVQDLAIEKFQYGKSFVPNLGLQRSQQSVIGVEQQITSSLSADLQGYYNWRYALAEVSTSASQDVQVANTGRGNVWGLELLVRQEVTKRMYGWLAYTLSRSTESVAAGQPYVPSAFDETHILTLVASYKFDYDIQVGLRFRYATGTPSTPITGATFDADILGYNPVSGTAGSTRQPPFNQLDIRIEKFWTFPLWAFSAFVDVQNVYNAENPATILYSFNYSQTAVVRGLPILPTLGVAGHF